MIFNISTQRTLCPSFNGVDLWVMDETAQLIASNRGNGIRSQAKFTVLFERLVNTIHDKSPGTKFIFNTMPDNTLDAAKRVFPELEGSAGKDEL